MNLNKTGCNTPRETPGQYTFQDLGGKCGFHAHKDTKARRDTAAQPWLLNVMAGARGAKCADTARTRSGVMWQKRWKYGA